MIAHLKKPAVAEFFYGKPDGFSKDNLSSVPVFAHVEENMLLAGVPTNATIPPLGSNWEPQWQSPDENQHEAPIGTLAKELHDVATASSQSHILTDKTIDDIKSIQADQLSSEEANQLLRKLNDIVKKLNQQIEGQKQDELIQMINTKIDSLKQKTASSRPRAS